MGWVYIYSLINQEIIILLLLLLLCGFIPYTGHGGYILLSIKILFSKFK